MFNNQFYNTADALKCGACCVLRLAPRRDESLSRHGVPFDYTVEDFERDAETSRYVAETRSKELQRR